MFKNAFNARTQREAVVEAIKRGATKDTHEGVTWVAALWNESIGGASV